MHTIVVFTAIRTEIFYSHKVLQHQYTQTTHGTINIMYITSAIVTM